MRNKKGVIIVGGGLAGLSSAIHLLQNGVKVLLIEKDRYPHHKVCGEFVSNEVLPYLLRLGIDPFENGAVMIKKLNFSSAEGKILHADLPLGGFGLSRYVLDQLFYQKAMALGCGMITDHVVAITYQTGHFVVETNGSGIFTTDLVIGAYGKRSALDVRSGRSFIQKKSPWLAVKNHYKGNFPDDVVGLYNFSGGYCGVSKVENGMINICYLVNYESFKKYKDIPEFEQQVLCSNPLLKEILNNSVSVFDQPLTISQVSFQRKETVHDHVLMTGDTAGLIQPLCGNGMAMAIHAGKIAAELVTGYLEDKFSRAELEKKYTSEWNKNFKNRLFMGRLLASVLRKEWLSGPLLNLLVKFPGILTGIVKRTHGQPID